MTRYPKIRLTERTPNPLVLVAMVRYELRRAGVGKSEIDAFSRAALSARSANAVRRVCEQWVDTRRLD